MTTVWWLVLPLYSLSFFSLHSLHICNIFVWRTHMTVVILPSPSPPTVLYFSSLTPPSWRLVLWKTKYKKKKKKSGCKQTSGETTFWWSRNDATSKCLRAGGFSSLWQKWDWAGVASISKASIPGYMLGTRRVESHAVLLSAFLC